MQHPFFYFLRAALVPVLCADITASAARYVHHVLVFIAAIRAPPDQLAVTVLNNLNFAGVAAFLAVVALCVQLGIHNVFINM